MQTDVPVPAGSTVVGENWNFHAFFSSPFRSPIACSGSDADVTTGYGRSSCPYRSSISDGEICSWPKPRRIVYGASTWSFVRSNSLSPEMHYPDRQRMPICPLSTAAHLEQKSTFPSLGLCRATYIFGMTHRSAGESEMGRSIGRTSSEETRRTSRARCDASLKTRHAPLFISTASNAFS